MCEPRPESIHPPGRNRPRFDRPPPSCTLRPSPESITYLPRCWWRPRPRHARFGGVGVFALSSVLSRACDSGGARRRCGITRRRRGKSGPNSGKHTQRMLLESSAAPQRSISGCLQDLSRLLLFRRRTTNPTVAKMGALLLCQSWFLLETQYYGLLQPVHILCP